MNRPLRDLVDQVNHARTVVGRPVVKTSDTEFGWRGFPKLSFDFLSRKAKAQLRNPETKQWVEERGDLDIPGSEPDARARIGVEEFDELNLPEKASVGPARVKDRKTVAGPETEDLFYKGYDFDLSDPYFMDEFALMQHFDKILPPTAENSALAKQYGDLIDKLFDPGVPRNEKPTFRELMLLGRGDNWFAKEWFGKDLLAGPGAPPIGLIKYPNEYERQKARQEGQEYDLPPIERQPAPSPAEVEAALEVVQDQIDEGIERGDRQLAAVADAAGYSKPPTLLPKDEYDAVPAEHLYRGVKARGDSPQDASEMMDQLKEGPFYVGWGSKTNGTYVGDRIEAESFANPRGLHPPWEDQYNADSGEPDIDPFAEPTDGDEEEWVGPPKAPPLSHDDILEYGEDSALITVKIHPDAKIASWDQLPPDIQARAQSFTGTVPNDVFRWLLYNGYDGIDLREFGELYGLAIINRGALIVRDDRSPTGPSGPPEIRDIRWNAGIAQPGDLDDILEVGAMALERAKAKIPDVAPDDDSPEARTARVTANLDTLLEIAGRSWPLTEEVEAASRRDLGGVELFDEELQNLKPSGKRRLSDAITRYPAAWEPYLKEIVDETKIGTTTGRSAFGLDDDFEETPVLAIPQGAASEGITTEALAVHELGHALELKIPGLKEAEKAFWDRRVGTTDPSTVKFDGALVPTRPDNPTPNWYSMKWYEDGTSELFTTLIEDMLGDGKLQNIGTDEELQAFIWGLLLTLGKR